MRLNSIVAKNYRTFQDLTLQFAKNYCTISGRNNAGKSCLIRLLSALFRTESRYPWAADETGFNYKEDKTQWTKHPVAIQIDYSLTITKEEDPALLSFIEKIASKKIDKPSVSLCVSYQLTESDGFTINVMIEGDKADDKAAKEIHKRIGLLSPDLVVSITKFHADFQGVRVWLPQLVENKERGYSYSVSYLLRPALDAVKDVIPALRAIERLASIETPAETPDLGDAETALDMEEAMHAP